MLYISDVNTANCDPRPARANSGAGARKMNGTSQRCAAHRRRFVSKKYFREFSPLSTGAPDGHLQM